MQYLARARRAARSPPGGACLDSWRPGQVACAALRLDCMVSQEFRSGPVPAPPAPAAPAAPLERGGLELALRPFGESRMLPRAAYADPAVFGWEQQNFFGGGWVCVARSEQLPEPGGQRAEAPGPGGVPPARGEDGEPRGLA